jgi:transcriptional regulator with XRE-family HTH domain
MPPPPKDVSSPLAKGAAGEKASHLSEKAMSDEAMGRRLREVRLARGFSQTDVAEVLGVSPAYLSLIETGKRPLQLPLLVQALELFGVQLDDFMQSLGEVHIDEGLARLLDEPLLRTLALSRRRSRRALGASRASPTRSRRSSTSTRTRASQLEHLLTDMARKERDRRTEVPGWRARVRLHAPSTRSATSSSSGATGFEALEARADALRDEHRLGELIRASRASSGCSSQLDVEGATLGGGERGELA